MRKYCRAAGIDPEALGGRGIGIHSPGNAAINDAIWDGATMHEVRESAGHADIRTTGVCFIRKDGDAEVAALESRSASRSRGAMHPPYDRPSELTAFRPDPTFAKQRSMR